MFEIALLILAIFLAPYVLIFVLWQRVGRLEQSLNRTLEWTNSVLRQVQEDRAPPSVEPVEAEPVAEEAPPVKEPAPEPAPEPEPEPEPISTAIPASRIERAPEPEPEREPEPATMAYSAETPDDVETYETPPEEPGWKFDFEDIFGKRLPIWAGGIALAIAGIFLVQYSIEKGLITPAIRVVMSFAFGLGLIASAEVAFRLEHKIEDERVRQALAGAGIATLFGAFYLAGTAYGLIGAGAAFIGLAAVTAGAIALSFRFGLPCAVLGLVGGFAAPVLVDSDSANVPLLALYLALVTGGLAWTGEQQGRRWLGYVALAVGLGWGFVLQLAGLEGSGDLAALGFYLIVLGTALPAFFAIRGGPSMPQVAAAGVATLQMAVLVSNGEFAPLTWGLYLLIGAALAGLGWRFPDLRAGSAIAALISLWLLALWIEPEPQFFTLVAAASALIFAAVPVMHQWRGAANLLDRGQIALVVLGIGATSYFHFGGSDQISGPAVLAVGMVALALLPAAAFALRWRSEVAFDPRDDLPLLGAAHILLFVAAMIPTPIWAAPILAALLAIAALSLLWRRDDAVLLIAGWAAIGISLFILIVTADLTSEPQRLLGQGAFEPSIQSALRWAACSLPLLAMGFIRTNGASRLFADALAAFVAYGMAAQVVPADALAWLAAIAAAGIFLLRGSRVAGWTAFLVISGLWTIEPLFGWAIAAGSALGGQPFLATEAITPIDIALRLAPFTLACAVIALSNKPWLRQLQAPLLAIGGAISIVAAHSLYKLAWQVTSMLRFEYSGMGERTIWQGVLVGAALATARLLKDPVAQPARIGLLVAALMHFGLFTLILHNPLYSVQHVGPTPIANWLSAAYGIAIASLILLRADAAAFQPRLRQAVDIAIMVLVSLLAVSLLRQVFAGTVLTASYIDPTESLLLSLLGITLALGFLWWGSFRQERIWRIGSLVLMLVAVLKVFLIDAAGLAGLLRIASFMALGFSLIGIGWVYSRQLRRTQPASA